MLSIAQSSFSSDQPQVPEKPSFTEPRIVSIFHDGREVVRIEDGLFSNLVETSQPQESLEIYWDGVLVYQLLLYDAESGKVVVNLMSEHLSEIAA